MKRKEGFIFKKFEAKSQSPFDRLFDIFKELITHTSGDFDEAINWLKELDKESVKKCFSYNYLNKYVAQERIPLLYDTDITMQFDKKVFWKKTYNLLKKNGVFYQPFYNSLKFQIENDNSYLVNLNKFKIKYYYFINMII
jgi:hypothetical protein